MVSRFGSQPGKQENRVAPHISSCVPTLQWHQGAFLLRDNGNDRVVSCKPGDTSFRIYAGQGAPVNGFNDLSRSTEHAVSPAGELFVVLFQDTGQHLLRIHDGVGQVLLELTDCVGLCCSPNGVLYVLENRGQRVQKLEGLALTTIFHTGQLPAGQQGSFKDMFVTGEEVLYITQHSRVLRLRAGDSVPSVVAEFVEREITELTKLFVTEEEQIFLVDPEKKRVWMTQPELSQAGVAALDTSSIGIPKDVLIQDRLMYVLVRGPPGSEGSAVYQYPLPPRLELEASWGIILVWCALTDFHQTGVRLTVFTCLGAYCSHGNEWKFLKWPFARGNFHATQSLSHWNQHCQPRSLNSQVFGTFEGFLPLSNGFKTSSDWGKCYRVSCPKACSCLGHSWIPKFHSKKSERDRAQVWANWRCFGFFPGFDRT